MASSSDGLPALTAVDCHRPPRDSLLNLQVSYTVRTYVEQRDWGGLVSGDAWHLTPWWATTRSPELSFERS
jgi:hypothetical protein